MPETKVVFQIRIELLGIEPPIWRRIEVPESHSFWDLHVAIQDSMGWQDSHLHHFRLIGSELVMGIPDRDDTQHTQPGWEHRIMDHLHFLSPLALYEYDFGDSWLHEVRWEDVRSQVHGIRYPRCTGGDRKCPPEDCGGPPGYTELVRVVTNPDDPQHGSILDWLGGDFDPDEFDPGAVRFDDPSERWRLAFAEGK